MEADTSLGRSLALVRYLREHCDWDARQTPESLLPYLLEEAHEVADAVRLADDGDLSGELGDLLLNIAFQVVLAEERGAFDAGVVAQRLERKMIDRHPHVFGNADVAPDWEAMKAAERAAGAGAGGAGGGAGGAGGGGGGAGGVAGGAGDRAGGAGPLAGIPRGLEPLSRALRVQERAAGVGFDWPDAVGAIEKLREEIEELEALLGDSKAASPSSAGTPPSPQVVEEAGDLLFAAVNVCRLAGVHPMTALEGATDKFSRRFREVVHRAEAAGLDMPTAGLEALDRIWDEVKAGEGGGSASEN